MKNKLLLLIVLIVLSMLGIVYLQVSWMHQTYGAEVNRVNRLADDALHNAINQLDNTLTNIDTNEEAADSLYYHADSAAIHWHLRQFLQLYGLGKLTDQAQLVFFGQESKDAYRQLVGNRGAIPLGTGLKEYRAGPASYRRWVAVYFHSHSAQVFPNIATGAILSTLLILVMGASFLALIWLLLRQKRIGKMKDDFITNLTHEFKTPISTVSAAMEALLDFNALKDPEKTHSYLTLSRRAITRLDIMVTHVLDMAANENNTLTIDKQPVDLGALVHQVVEAEKSRMDKTAVFITVDIDAYTGMVNLDRHHFGNVLANLFDNALKYSGETVNVAISVSAPGDGMVHIAVSDDGIGIAPADQQRVFDKFFRVYNGNVHDTKGTGIGLSYVKAIVELHDGTVSVKSTPGVGTTFHIYLPLA